MLCGGVDVVKAGSGESHPEHSGLVSRLPGAPGAPLPDSPGGPSCSAALTRRTRCFTCSPSPPSQSTSRCPTAPRAECLSSTSHPAPPPGEEPRSTFIFLTSEAPKPGPWNLSLQSSLLPTPTVPSQEERVSRERWPPTDHWSQRSRLAECLSSGLPASCKPSRHLHTHPPASPHTSSQPLTAVLLKDCGSICPLLSPHLASAISLALRGWGLILVNHTLILRSCHHSEAFPKVSDGSFILCLDSSLRGHTACPWGRLS